MDEIAPVTNGVLVFAEYPEFSGDLDENLEVPVLDQLSIPFLSGGGCASRNFSSCQRPGQNSFEDGSKAKSHHMSAPLPTLSFDFVEDVSVRDVLSDYYEQASKAMISLNPKSSKI